jgi:hypothetical protein
MALIQRIFRMVGVEGLSMNAVARRLEAEGIPSPGGKRFWNRPGLRKLIMSDVYLAHTHEEVVRIVTPEVAARLDPKKRYGISWYGRQRHTHTQEARIKMSRKSILVSRRAWRSRARSGSAFLFPIRAFLGVGARSQGSHQGQQKGFELRPAILGAHRRRVALRRLRLRHGDQLPHGPRDRLLPLR